MNRQNKILKEKEGQIIVQILKKTKQGIIKWTRETREGEVGYTATWEEKKLKLWSAGSFDFYYLEILDKNGSFKIEIWDYTNDITSFCFFFLITKKNRVGTDLYRFVSNKCYKNEQKENNENKLKAINIIFKQKEFSNS